MEDNSGAKWEHIPVRMYRGTHKKIRVITTVTGEHVADVLRRLIDSEMKKVYDSEFRELAVNG